MDYLSPTTELEAINLMISVIGELPLDDLDSQTGNADVLAATTLLRSCTRALQYKGWAFNTDLCTTLYREPDGTILVPPGVVKITKAEVPSQAFISFSERGGRLYDRTGNTTVWTVDLVVDLVRILAFEDLPEAARLYALTQAGLQFQARYVGSDALYKFSESDLVLAAQVLAEYELDTGHVNFLTGSRDVRRIWRDREFEAEPVRWGH